MKSAYLFLFVLAGCANTSDALGFADRQIEYQKSSDESVIVMIQQDGVGNREAQQEAYKRAAEKTVGEGLRYFKVLSEGNVWVIQSDKSWPDNQSYPQNLYQELIIENDFDRERLRDRAIPSERVVKGYRVVFQPVKEKGGRKTIDACRLTDCEG